MEPTESEPKEELDRFIAALKTIRDEIVEIGEGKADKTDNVLKNAPHTHRVLTADEKYLYICIRVVEKVHQ